VDTIGKVFKEKRNILEYIKEGKVGMIFNTPSGTYERSDARKIRTVAFSYRVPCFTTIPSASAAVNAVEARKKSSPFPPLPPGHPFQPEPELNSKTFTKVFRKQN
jgi:carbamoyl-phosphate synthase large subunit